MIIQEYIHEILNIFKQTVKKYPVLYYVLLLLLIVSFFNASYTFGKNIGEFWYSIHH